jgi:hypothetical protein
LQLEGSNWLKAILMLPLFPLIWVDRTAARYQQVSTPKSRTNDFTSPKPKRLSLLCRSLLIVIYGPTKKKSEKGV